MVVGRGVGWSIGWLRGWLCRRKLRGKGSVWGRLSVMELGDLRLS